MAAQSLKAMSVKHSLHLTHSCRTVNLFTSHTVLSPSLVISSHCIQQRAPLSKKNKTYFSRTYQPRFNWVTELAQKKEKNTALTPDNQRYIQNKALQLPSVIKSPLLEEPWPRASWKSNGRFTMRSGVIGVKIGVVPQWTVTGKKILCTMLQVLDNHVIDYKSPEEFAMMTSCTDTFRQRGYGAVFVGAVSASPLEFSEDYNRLFEKSGVPPKRKITKFIVTPDAAIPPGTPLNAQHFRVGDYLDLNSRTIEMGFQGVTTRWGMKGGRASHGVTKAHNRIGSIGGGGDKGGIWKGKKMPGHMGSLWRYHRGLQVVRINTKYNVVYVKGPMIPGPPRSYVRMLDTMLRNKRPLLDANPPPMPTFYPEDVVPDTPENLYHESLFTYDDDYVSYKGVDPDSLHLYSKQYILFGGCHNGKNHSYRRGI